MLGISAKNAAGVQSVIERVQPADTGVPTDGEAPAAPGGGNLLEQLQNEQNSTGVPTSE